MSRECNYEMTNVLAHTLPTFFSFSEWKRCYAWDIEHIFMEMRKSAQRSGQPVTKYVFVGDLGGFSFTCAADFAKHGIPLLKKLSGEIERYYPECAGPIVLINVGR